MKFGSREVANVVFRAKNKMTLGSRTFYKDEPVLYFDSLKTSGLEGASTSVYAQGGWGNPRLIGWDGDKTLTLTMEDALISPEGLAILTSANMLESSSTKKIYVHMTSQVKAVVGPDRKVTMTLPKVNGKPVDICWNKARGKATGSGTGYVINAEADIFCMKVDENGDIIGDICVPNDVKKDADVVINCDVNDSIKDGDIVLVDYYVEKQDGYQFEITADTFSGNFYIEGETLYRRESDGMDMPAEFIIPNGKVQSNFNIAMSNSGDPSTFTFTVDCFPAYPKFLVEGEARKKVLALLQIITDNASGADGEIERRQPCDGTLPEG